METHMFAHYPAPPFLTVKVPCKVAPLWWHERGLTYTASGYGRKIPTTRMVQLPGSKRWRRVYVCIFSNAGTAYVLGERDPSTGKRAWITFSDY